MKETFSDLDTGWAWVVLMAMFASSFVIGGVSYSIGIVHSTLLDMYKENHATTSVVGALYTSLTYLAAPVCSMVIDRFGARTALVTSGILYTIGYVTTAFAPSLQLTMVTCGVISGLGGAFGLTASMVTVGFYFRRYQNIAFGIAISGTGLGVFGIAPIIQSAKEYYGTTGFFIVLACVAIHLIVFGTTAIPSKLELHTQKNRKRELQQGAQSSSAIVKMGRDYVSVLTTKSITCIGISILLFCKGLFIILLYLPDYCMKQGASPMQASFVISASGAAGIFGRIITGIAANCQKVPEVALFSGSMLCMGIVTLLFPLFSSTYKGQLVFAVVFGLFYGSPYITMTTISISYVGMSKMAAAIGIELCLGGIGATIGPIIAGLLIDNGGTYEHAFIMAGITLIVAAVMGILSKCFAKTNGETVAEMLVEGTKSPMLKYDTSKSTNDTQL